MSNFCPRFFIQAVLAFVECYVGFPGQSMLDKHWTVSVRMCRRQRELNIYGIFMLNHMHWMCSCNIKHADIAILNGIHTYLYVQPQNTQANRDRDEDHVRSKKGEEKKKRERDKHANTTNLKKYHNAMRHWRLFEEKKNTRRTTEPKKEKIKWHNYTWCHTNICSNCRTLYFHSFSSSLRSSFCRSQLLWHSTIKFILPTL